MQQKGLAALSTVCFITGALVPIFVGLMAKRVITMLWGHFAFQLTRLEMRFVQILKVLCLIPPLSPYAANGAGGIERCSFLSQGYSCPFLLD